MRIEPSTISGVCNRWRCHFGLSATTERDRGFADSLLEGAVYCELVSIGRKKFEPLRAKAGRRAPPRPGLLALHRPKFAS